MLKINAYFQFHFYILISFCVLINTSLAFQSEKNESVIDIEDHYKRNELDLLDDILIYDIDTNTNIKNEVHYTKDDSSKVNVGLIGVNNLLNPLSHFGYDANYSFKFADELWANFNFTHIYTIFTNIGENKTGESVDSSNSESEFNQVRDSLSSQNIMLLSAGIGSKFKFLSPFISSEKAFEEVNTFASYILMNDSHTSKTFKGFGFKADYIMEYRVNMQIFWNAKLSYHWGKVSRASNGLDFLPDRTIMLSWLNLGFSVGFYF
jgi:hypothetical protein